jgi:glutathione synthase/RimK-type ligase-like ATP-grasp enzyme
MKQIALVSYAACPQLTDDDRLLIPAFARRGVRAVPAVWDADISWSQFDRVVLRSCWDYHLRLSEFLKWIERLERLDIPLSNSARLVRWNADKSYLRELKARGVRIPPTFWIEAHEERDVATILRKMGWASAIAKPVVSASAHGLQQVSVDRPAAISGPVMIQPFLTEVPNHGEWSLVFIGGEYSHTVLKRAAPGEFRVQWQYGGTATSVEPHSEALKVATKIIGSLESQPDYARVDGIVCGDDFVLMELELIEPVLFLRLGNAADQFVEAILNAT